MSQQSLALFNAAQLALAAYANLAQGQTVAGRESLVAIGFTARQVDEFAARYPIVLTTTSDSASGLQATVFKDTAGNLTLAFRGTEIPEDLATGANIVISGAAYQQIVAMYNWWLRATAVSSDLVDQYRIVGYAPTSPPAPGPLFLYQSAGVLFFLESAPSVLGAGELVAAMAGDPDARVDVTGHSLGGHLSMAFSSLFAARTGGVTVFNAPGFMDSATNRDFFSRLGGAIPTGASIVNVAADEAVVDSNPFNWVAGMHSRPGTQINIAIEKQTNSDEPNPFFPALNHSIVALADSLAVFNLLSTLAPALTTNDYKMILNQAANGTSASSERIVDALETLFGINRTLLETGNTHRDALYAAIYELRSNSSFTAFSGQLQVTPLGSFPVADDLASIAQGLTAFGYRYALRELNPFAILGDNSIYVPHNQNGELDLYDGVNRTGTLTADWIADRAKLLYADLVRNTLDISDPQVSVNLPGSGDTATEFRHYRAGNEERFIAQPSVRPPGSIATHLIMFADDVGRVLTGTDDLRGDRLYGGSGIDYIEGKANDDYLEGGKGLDIYQYKGPGALSNGADVIRDIDGKGVLRYTYAQSGMQSTVIADASRHVSGLHWTSADQRFIYMRSQNDLIVTVNDGTGTSITLKDFRDGDFGIRLWEARAAPQITNTIDAATYGDDEAIHDTAGNDLISGDARDNVVNASTGGSNWIQGADGRDMVYALTGSTSDSHLIEGGTGDDLLTGGPGNDELYANARMELAAAISAGSGAGNGLHGDWLSGDWGDDVLVGDASNDGFAAGPGKDIVAAGAGDDNIFGDADWVGTTLDWYYVDDLLTKTRSFYWFNGSDNYDIGDADVIYAGSGSDYVWAGGGDDLVWGELGDDLLMGQSGSDVLIGAAGNDQLWGDDDRIAPSVGGADYLDGGAGDDVLQGQGGSDVLIGGAGNDTLVGGAGKDIYVFNKGDGIETVFDDDTNPSNPDASVLVLGDGVDKNAIKFKPGSLAVDIGPSDPADPNSPHDEIHFNGFDQLDPWATMPLAEIHFSDGSSMSYAEILTRGFDIDGTAGNDTGQPGDAPQLVGTGVSDRIRGFGGNDVLFGLSGDDTLDGGADSDQLVGGAGLDQLLGGDGDDSLWGDENGLAAADQGADYMSGGAGNDYIQAYGGDDTLLGESGNDTLHGQAGADHLEGGDGNDFLWGDVSGAPLAEQGNDTLHGGTGNDQLVGYAGNDTYAFGRGYGQDIIFDQDTTTGNVDCIEFVADITPDDVTASRPTGTYNLTLAINGTTDVLTVANYFFSTSDRVEEIRFADGTLWTPSTIPLLTRGTAGNDVLNGTTGSNVFEGLAGNDTMAGGGGNDVYRVFRGDGQDTIIDSDAALGNVDSIVYSSDISSSDVQAARSGANLVLRLTGTTDQVTVTNYFLNDGVTPYSVEQIKFLTDGTVWDVSTVKQVVLTGTSSNDSITGYSTDDALTGLGGNDTLNGNAGRDTLNGGGGNDYLNGGTGDDVYIVARADGRDSITDVDATVGNIDRIVYLGDVLPSEVQITREYDALLLTIAGTNDQLIVNGYFQNDGSNPNVIEYVQFTDGTTWDVAAVKLLALVGTSGNDSIVGYATDDVLSGGAGNDTLAGGRGNDTYLISRNNGQDYVFDSDSTPGNVDKLVYTETLPSELFVYRISYWLVLRDLNTFDNMVQIGSYFSDTDSPVSLVEEVHFLADGTIWDVDDIRAMVIAPDDGQQVIIGYTTDDYLRGLGGPDSIFGGLGNDTLDGGTGDDTLYGEGGSDTYLFEVGSGQDTIYNARSDAPGTADVLEFGTGIIPSQIIPTRSAYDLVLTVSGTLDQVIVDEYFLGYDANVELIRFGDGTIWNEETLAALLPLDGTSGNDYLQGGSLPDAINGFAGNDVLQGIDSNDTLDGGLGSDTLYGGAGNDMLIAGAGEAKNAMITNVLYGESGNDVLISSGKTDSLYGDAGNDLMMGAGGVDLLQDYSGNNLFFGAAGPDTIRLGDGNDILLAGAGNDAVDGDFDNNGSRGRDILAFNKSDGIDTVTRLGTGSTISIGGGTLYSNLSLEVSGTTLRLKTASSSYIALSDWYGAAPNKSISTLQIVIEGTRDYKSTSTNPLYNKKIQTFDFIGLVNAFDAARAAGQTFNVANNLAAYRIGGSDTEMIGGAIAYQYARTGNLGTLTYDQMQAVINDPAFGAFAQSITAPVVATALDMESSAEASAQAVAAATPAPDTATSTTTGGRTSDEFDVTSVQTIQPESFAMAAEQTEGNATPPIPDSVALADMATEHLPSLPEQAVARTPPDLRVPLASEPAPSAFGSPPATRPQVHHRDALASVPQSVTQPEAAPADSQKLADDAPVSSDVSNREEDVLKVASFSPSTGTETSHETGTLLERWFTRYSLNDDLTQLDDIMRGEAVTNSAANAGIFAAAWRRSHAWLNGRVPMTYGEESGGFAAGYLGTSSLLGDSATFSDVTRSTIGLRNVAGHDLRSFSGLRDGVNVLAA